MPRRTTRQEMRWCIAHVRRHGAPVVMGISAEQFEDMVPAILRGADLEDREREQKRRERMMASQTTKTAPPSLTEELYARAAQEAEHQRGAAGRAYLAALNKHAAPDNLTPGNIVAALEAERRAFAACDAKVRPALVAALKTYAEPPPEAPRMIADQVRAIRSGAQGALNILNDNPARLAYWIEKITTIPGDVGSAENLAEAHWDHIRCLLGSARGLPAVPADLAAVAQVVETLTAKLLATGVPAAVLPRGSGPLPQSLETSRAPRSYKARTEVDHS